MTPAINRPVENQYYPPFALRSPYYDDMNGEIMPDGMTGFRIVTVYDYYDMPLMYTLENDKEIYFSYWLGTDQERGLHTMSYLRITRDEQAAIENGDMCLRSVLTSRPALIVERDMNKTGWPVASFQRDIMLGAIMSELPEPGLDITIFAVKQIPDKVALHYRTDANISMETLVHAAGKAVNDLWERFFIAHNESGKRTLNDTLLTLYKKWYCTLVSSLAAGDNTVHTPNLVLIPVNGEEALQKVEQIAWDFIDLDTAISTIDEKPICVATLTTSVYKERPARARRTLACHSKDAGAALTGRICHDEFKLSLVKEFSQFYRSLTMFAEDEQHDLAISTR